MEKRWNVLQADNIRISDLYQSLKISPILCKILVQRNIHTFDEAKAFFRPQIKDLHNPWLMKDMDKAVERLLLAFEKKEKILIYGDYDVDGTTSVAVMYQFIKSLYPCIEYYIPHRYREGYGISKAGIEYAKENNVSLVISLDCGIKSIELIHYAKTNGIDFIVCDHHLPDADLPDAVAILNAKQIDCNYPYKELCGCGVGLKLIQATCDHLKLPDETWMQYLDLVATAIAADIVPMTGENRILAHYGLKKANENPSIGIKALMELAGLKENIHINNLVFVIAPRVNAAGRMDDAKKAVQLFIEKNYEQALELAKLLHNDNSDRKETDMSITEEAMDMIASDSTLMSRRTTVLYQKHWHKGVVGIVASRLIDRYYRPTIVLTDSGDKIAGSARSVSGFNVYEAIHECKDLLENYGGHFYAAGLTMKPENLPLFQQKFEEVVSGSIKEEMLRPEIIIDGEIKFSDINFSLYNIIAQMEPYGPENMRPVFIARNLTDAGYSRILKDAHIKFYLKQKNIVLEGIGFNMADKFTLLQCGPIDAVFTLDENSWNGEKRLQLKILDIKPSINDYD